MRYLLLLFVLSSLICIGCKSEPKIEESAILGKWIVVEAERNAKPTLTLKDAFFEFRENGELITNILGQDHNYPFQLKQGIIYQHDIQNTAYEIAFISTDSLHLKTEIRNFQFDFYTKREMEQTSE